MDKDKTTPSTEYQRTMEDIKVVKRVLRALDCLGLDYQRRVRVLAMAKQELDTRHGTTS